MNDFREVQYGWDMLLDAWHRQPGNAFRESVEATYPGMVAEIAPLLDSWHLLVREHTYLTCVSEHDISEDHLGRLSMWRAYGGDCGVALVLSPEVMGISSPAFAGMYSVPVLYAEQPQLDAYVDEIARNISGARTTIQRRGRQEFKDWLFHLLRLLVISTKHPGFAEEREWRVTYSPHLGPSPIVTSSVEVVRGTPQIVFKIPLRDHSEHSVHGLDLPRLIDLVIVGPTQYPQVVADALRQLLEVAGDTDARSKLVMSQIPLRHS